MCPFPFPKPPSAIIATDSDTPRTQRNKAWEVHHYPCLGQFRFLELNLSARPSGDLYARLLSMLKSSEPSSVFQK